MMGSRKYPTERDNGHSCVTDPPVIMPGCSSSDAPWIWARISRGTEQNKSLAHTSIRNLDDRSVRDFVHQPEKTHFKV